MILPGAEPFFLPGGPKGVLLIHGFTGLPAELLLMGQYLHKLGFTVLGVRLAGHGTTVEDMSHMTWEDWMDSVRDGYAVLSGFCESIDVIGHSMGGLFSLLLSTEEKVRKVVTMAAPIQIAQERGIKFLPPREVCNNQFIPKARRRLKGVPEAVNKTYRKMPLIGVHELVDVIEATKGCIDKVSAPVLIMHSHDDHTAAPSSAGYIYEHVKSEDRRVFWLEKSGHLLPVAAEREKVFAEAAAFLQSSDA
ncbi:MAG: alpha/beta fold hydrolase [Selenomonas sp.]|uniref:alpha/beta hydrolase n=1 Tax=Selenomonas sp. TaxID=2053611 RepID=UPI0025FB4BA6|nr:alpha/beta fold hydrolase [Selenomonas sp.]MCR5438081.1 alpha/beta fold hydrolase [Selenomonas sp.]